MSYKIKTLIVDDEPLAIVALRSILEEVHDIQIIGESANGFEALKLIQEQEVDLVFLDIQMPKLDGFDVIELTEDMSSHYRVIAEFVKVLEN